MPKASQDSSTQGGDQGAVVEGSEELGDCTVNFLTSRDDIDQTPMLKGLADDRCQCPHWGYVTKGRLTYRFADHEEVFEAGDAFMQFSPTEELRTVSEAIMKNMQGAQGQ